MHISTASRRPIRPLAGAAPRLWSERWVRRAVRDGGPHHEREPAAHGGARRRRSPDRRSRCVAGTVRSRRSIDEAAYGGVVAASALPKDGDDAQRIRTAALQRALAGAAEAPLAVAGMCAEGIGARAARASSATRTSSATWNARCISSARRWPRASRTCASTTASSKMRRSCTARKTARRDRLDRTRSARPAAAGLARCRRGLRAAGRPVALGALDRRRRERSVGRRVVALAEDGQRR